MYMLLLAKNEDTLNGCSTHHDNPLEFTCIWYIAFAITYPMLLVDKNWTVIKHTIMIQWCLEYFVKKLLKPCNIEYTSKITDDTRGIALRHRSWAHIVGRVVAFSIRCIFPRWLQNVSYTIKQTIKEDDIYLREVPHCATRQTVDRSWSIA